MAFDDLLGDVEAEPKAAVVCRRHLAAAMEALEDLPQLVSRDTDAAVRDRGHDLIAAIFDRDEDLAAVRRVLDRVLHQIAEHLLKPVAIAEHPFVADREVELETAIVDRGVMAMNDIADERGPRNRLPAELPAAGSRWA